MSEEHKRRPNRLEIHYKDWSFTYTEHPEGITVQRRSTGDSLWMEDINTFKELLICLLSCEDMLEYTHE